MNSDSTPEVASVADGVTSAQDTNQSHSPVFAKDNKPVVKLESSCKKEEKIEGAKKDEPKSETQKAPITPKGKYELRASTLIPRDYGDEDEDEEDDGKKKNVEAVIDLTEDDDAPVVTKEKTPIKTEGPGMHT